MSSTIIRGNIVIWENILIVVHMLPDIIGLVGTWDSEGCPQ